MRDGNQKYDDYKVESVACTTVGTAQYVNSRKISRKVRRPQ